MDPCTMARRTPGTAFKDWEPGIDVDRLRRYRLGRVQDQLARLDCAAALLFGAVNVRYATGTRSCQIYNLHSPYRSAFVPTEGRVVMYDWGDSASKADLPPHIAGVRRAHVFTYFPAGERSERVARTWAGEIASLVREHGGGNRRLAVDIIEPVALLALMREQIDVVSAERVMELATSIKCEEELMLMSQTAAIAEAGLARMREALRPGITENELWGQLHLENIRNGGEWTEYRLCSSGGRTNPWGQECSDRMIRAGELVAIDTGMIGPWGYGADISRTFHCKPGRPSADQQRLYRLADEHIRHNLGLIEAGVDLEELSRRSWPIPDEFLPQRYPLLFHGVGMGDEWPAVAHAHDWPELGDHGALEENMVIAVESYMGALGGLEGVKLEEMVVVRRGGYQMLSTFPREEDLLA